MTLGRFMLGLLVAAFFILIGASTGDAFWIVLAVIVVLANIAQVIAFDRVPKATTYREEHTMAPYTAPTPRRGDTFPMTDVDGVTYVCVVVRPMHAEPLGHMCVADHPKYGRIEVTVDPRTLSRAAG